MLATLATIIASQALISGAFSLAWQAIGLGLFPRLESGTPITLMPDRSIFRSSIGCSTSAASRWSGVRLGSALAAAYGLAVSGVMLITSVAMFAVARR